MNAKQIKIYIFILIGIGVLYLGVTSVFNLDKLKINTCFLKAITGIPCPTCGTTRAIFLLFNGQIYNSLLLNPLGSIVVLCVVICTTMFMFDLLFAKKSIEYCIKKIKAIENKKPLIVLFFVFLFVNWIWNIIKMN